MASSTLISFVTFYRLLRLRKLSLNFLIRTHIQLTSVISILPTKHRCFSLRSSRFFFYNDLSCEAIGRAVIIEI